MNHRTDLILSEVFYISIFFHILASWIHVLSAYDFYFWLRDTSNTAIYKVFYKAWWAKKIQQTKSCTRKTEKKPQSEPGKKIQTNRKENSCTIWIWELQNSCLGSWTQLILTAKEAKVSLSSWWTPYATCKKLFSVYFIFFFSDHN